MTASRATELAIADSGWPSTDQLDLDALRDLLSAGAPGISYHHTPSLLAHAPVAGLDAFDALDVSLPTGHPRSFPPQLSRALKRAGITCHRSNEALTSELAYLLRFFAALSGDPAPRLQLRWVHLADPGDRPWTGPAARPRLAMTQRMVSSAQNASAPYKVESAGQVWQPELSAPPVYDGGDRALVAHLSTERAYATPALELLPTAPDRVDVLLVSMPFGLILQPSLGLGLLKGTLGNDITSRILYLNLGFARRVGVPFYNWVAHAMPSSMELVGEWIFAAALHDSEAHLASEIGSDDAYLTEVLGAENRRWIASGGDGPFLSTLIPDGLMGQFRRARRMAPGFIGECVDAVLAHGPRVVGLTSLFQQQTASLALARRLHERAPEIAVVLGGPNCEGIMGVETARRFRFLDAVVLGEGERVFPEIVDRVLANEGLDDLAGVYTPASADLVNGIEPTAAPAVTAMDDLPYPDHHDFDAQWRSTELAGAYATTLLFETARGCWWGQKHHCTFCGLNGTGMAFRSKSPQRALDEYRALTGAHPGTDVATVDNILDMRYFGTFLAELAGTNAANRLFYEVKSNLKREHVRALHAANVTWIQPGIESLSDQVLSLMQKGVSTLQNIQLLKWCQELGVTPLWNIIWGFPGEDPSAYDAMADLLPLLTHLYPPMGMGRVQVHRFSPNFFDAERLGFGRLHPAPAYAHIHSFDDATLANLAYFFDYDTAVLGDVRGYTRRVSVEIRAWQEAHATSTLRAIDRGDSMIVHDGRPGARTPLLFLDELERAILLQCDQITSLDQVYRAVARTRAGRPSESEIDAATERLARDGLILRRGQRALGIVLQALESTHGDSSPTIN